MDPDELHIKYGELLKSSDFHEFEILADNPNIFEILRTQRYEIRHSNFLAWLLDPNQTHGLGNHFLKLILYDLTVDTISEVKITDIHQLDYSNVKVYREWKSIDILIVFKDLVIVIENKIHHIESSGQLLKYYEEVERSFQKEKKLFVFLSPKEEKPSHPQYIKYGYSEICLYIEQILGLNKSMEARTRVYLEDYVENLKNNIMGNSSRDELVNKIYYQHKQLFDYVIRNRSSEILKIKETLINEIKRKGWKFGTQDSKFIRFLTPKLAEVVPTGLSGWRDGEAVLFEVKIDEKWEDVSVFFTISSFSGILKDELINKLNNHYSGNVGGWYSYYKKKFIFEEHEFNSENMIKEILAYIEEMVAVIEPILLDIDFSTYKEKFRNL